MFLLGALKKIISYWHSGAWQSRLNPCSYHIDFVRGFFHFIHSTNSPLHSKDRTHSDLQ